MSTDAAFEHFLEVCRGLTAPHPVAHSLSRFDGTEAPKSAKKRPKVCGTAIALLPVERMTLLPVAAPTEGS